MAMLFPSKDQSGDMGRSRLAGRVRPVQFDALLMKASIVLVFVFVGSMIFGLL